MTFENYKTNDNAESTLLGDISASVTTLQVNTGEGALFPTTYPFILTLECFNETSQVIKREFVKVTGTPATDAFTIVRQFATCVQDETANPKVRSNNPQSFTSGDKVSLYVTAVDDENVKEEIERLETDKLDVSTYNQEKQAFASTSTGTDAYAITVSGVTSYINGQTFKVGADVANTGSATLNVNSLGVKTLKKLKDEAFEDLVDNDIIVNQIFWATYNSAEDCFQFSVDPASATVIDVEKFSKSITAGENMSILQVYRKGEDGLGEDTDKFYIAESDDTDKLKIEGIVNSGVTTGNNFDGSFQGIIGGFTSLTGRDILTATATDITQTTHNASYVDLTAGVVELALGQKFTPATGIKISNIIVNSDNATNRTYKIEIFKAGVSQGFSDNKAFSVSGEVTFVFSSEIILDAGTEYEFRLIYISASSPFYSAWRYNTTSVMAGVRTLGGIDSTGDVYFILNGLIVNKSTAGSALYLQDDGTIDVNPGTNEVVVGNIFSDTEILFINKTGGKISTTATTGAVVLGNAEGYVTINIPGIGNKKIPYYGV